MSLSSAGVARAPLAGVDRRRILPIAGARRSALEALSRSVPFSHQSQRPPGTSTRTPSSPCLLRSSMPELEESCGCGHARSLSYRGPLYQYTPRNVCTTGNRRTLDRDDGHVSCPSRRMRFHSGSAKGQLLAELALTITTGMSCCDRRRGGAPPTEHSQLLHATDRCDRDSAFTFLGQRRWTCTTVRGDGHGACCPSLRRSLMISQSSR